jgi:hypothetical protein
MPATCFGCGAQGHIEPNCPNKAGLAEDAGRDARPRWCGMCDRRSRHTELGDGRARRCPTCHPESHLPLKHHRKCEHCRKTVVEWDSAIDCEHHILAGMEHVYVGAPVCVRPEPVEYVGTGQAPAEYPAGVSK